MEDVSLDPASIEAQHDAAFRWRGLQPPAFKWAPVGKDIVNPTLRVFAAKCRLRTSEGDRVPENMMTVDSLGSTGPWCALLSRPSENGPFVFEHFGERLAELVGEDKTGQQSDKAGDFASRFATSLYTAVAKRGEWLFVEQDASDVVPGRKWQSLIVPLFGPRGDVTGIASTSVPENELGPGLNLISDPVFVLDAGETVIHANPAAVQMFHVSFSSIAPARLHDLTGVALGIEQTPKALLANGDVIERIDVIKRGATPERIAVTIHATQHREEAYFVVEIRLLGL